MAPSKCTGSMQAIPITSSCARHAARGGQRQPSSAGSAQARSSSPSRHPRPPMRRTASPTTCPSWRASRPGSSSGKGEAWDPGTGRPQLGGRHGPGESCSENGHGRGDHHGRHPAGDPGHGVQRSLKDGGSELPALPPPTRPGDPEEGGAA